MLCDCIQVVTLYLYDGLCLQRLPDTDASPQPASCLMGEEEGEGGPCALTAWPISVPNSPPFFLSATSSSLLSRMKSCSYTHPHRLGMLHPCLSSELSLSPKYRNAPKRSRQIVASSPTVSSLQIEAHTHLPHRSPNQGLLRRLVGGSYTLSAGPPRLRFIISLPVGVAE